jgi:hypothetical protein
VVHVLIEKAILRALQGMDERNTADHLIRLADTGAS